MMGKPDHFVVTRFNVQTAGRERKIATQPGWLEHRIELFCAYTLPSMLAQTTDAFRWIIYFDRDTPDDAKAWAEQAISSHPHFEALFVKDWSHRMVIDDIRARSDASRILSTRIDNDDAVSTRFVQRIQEWGAAAPDNAVMVPARGFVLSSNILYERLDHTAPFGSRVEASDAFETIWSVPHVEIEKMDHVDHLADEPLWIQVVHGRNVSNRVRGRMVPLSRASGFVDEALRGIESPGLAKRVVDQAVMNPVRGGRDLLRATARRVLVKLGSNYDGRMGGASDG